MRYLAVMFICIMALLFPLTENGWMNPLDTYKKIHTLHSEVSPELYQALVSLRDNSPDDITVLSWWDYGHAIIVIANRKVVSSPTNQFQDSHMFFGAQTVEEANSYVKNTKVRYILITEDMTKRIFGAIYIGMPQHPIQRPIPETEDGKKEVYRNSMLNKLWTEQNIEGYKLKYRNQKVKIYEVIK